MNSLGKYIMIIGGILVVVGLILWLFGDKMGFIGNLPGDIKVKKENFTIFFPMTTMILVSVVVSFFLWLIGKLFQ